MRFMVEGLRYSTLDIPFVGDIKPYHHQHATLEAIETAMDNNETVCIINTSVTGSGKTLANFASAILQKTPTIGVYPTKELIADQANSLLRKSWLTEDDLVKIDSDELDRWQDEIGVKSHIQALEVITFSWQPTPVAFLTNPDILYLIMYNLYGYEHKIGTYRERVFQAILNNYPIIAFDEFHLYDAKQVGNVAFIVGTISRLAPNKPHIFIFSSATPRDIEGYLERLGLKVINVTFPPESQGRTICENLTLELIPANLARWEGREAIENAMPTIDKFVRQYPGARGVFIVDSVYDAKLIQRDLSRRYPTAPIGEVHGYIDKTARANALEQPLTVGTTTIDVGVDLTGNKAKDFIVFEGKSAEQFIQRLGRLGRRGRDKNEINIPNVAWGIVPHYVHNYLAEKFGDTNSKPISRLELLEAIREVYTTREYFRRYARKYSPYEAVAAMQRILRQYLSDDLEQAREKLQRVILQLYRNAPPGMPKDEVARINGGILSDQIHLWEKFGEVNEQIFSDGKVWREWYLKEIETFRGGGEFECALYDKTDEKKGFMPFKTYNLPFVLRRTDFQLVSKQRYEELVGQKYPAQADEILRRINRTQPLGYLQINALVEGNSNKFWFEIEESELPNDFKQVIKIRGFNICSDVPIPLRQINRALERRELICWISQDNPWHITRNMPPLFAIYPLRPVGVGGESRIGSQFWSIAFGLNAFLLDAVFT